MSRCAPLASLSALACLAALALACAPPPAEPAYRVGRAVAHDNLTVVFLHGPDAVVDDGILTLEEALAAKAVVVHETKNVNELAIENVGTKPVFLQAGDIVKGGQQDRTIGQDMIVPAKSGKLPLASFCVEAGRWAGRAGESTVAFNGSSYALSNNALKLACRAGKSQGLVWKEVAAQQEKLAKVVAAPVKDAKSATSLQLTLENAKVKEAIDKSVAALVAGLPCSRSGGDVVGYAVAVNGKVVSADVYPSGKVFRKLWAKLARAVAVEALSEKAKDAKVAAVKAETFEAFLASTTGGKRTTVALGKDRTETRLDAKSAVRFETRDAKGAMIRYNVLQKPDGWDKVIADESKGMRGGRGR